ncbi:Hypothetical_protein [Hexamita inflata]|uniref:Hypothetical_protein n=1 Tax=Hexamita inflata TaxID=28002 RepID=A0AA86TTW7_9EUKA|nr:Hypothetical protein HINF_LOCUS15990 [Hexamita inflata]
MKYDLFAWQTFTFSYFRAESASSLIFERGIFGKSFSSWSWMSARDNRIFFSAAENSQIFWQLIKILGESTKIYQIVDKIVGGGGGGGTRCTYYTGAYYTGV